MGRQAFWNNGNVHRDGKKTHSKWYRTSSSKHKTRSREIAKMELAVDVFNYILSAILFGVSITWILLIRSMWISFRDSPYLDKFTEKSQQKPKVSIILLARNEEQLIGK